MNPLILIVDDHEPNRETLRELLADQKYHFCEAVDGPSALRIAQETPPDLVLLDVMMSGMDGYEVCRRLRADDQLAEVPIVLVTALDDRASRLRGIKAGADDFVSKPFNGTELRSRVRTITRLNRYRRLMNADADLLKSKLRLRAMAENSEDVFRLYSLNPLKVDYLSPSAESVWGYHPDRYCENPDIWLQQVHPDDHPRVESAFAAIVSNQTAHFAEEYRIVHPDRSVRWISDRGTAIHDENRVLIGFGSVARDITARKEAAEKLLRAQRIESLGMLAAGIAHDFNNALAPVLMGGEMLGQYVSDPKGQKMLNNMNNGAKRGAGLVKQLLAFTRGSGGDKVPMQLRHILRELGDQAESIFPKDIRVRMHLPVDLALVAGIPTQIHQIFLNLFVKGVIRSDG